MVKLYHAKCIWPTGVGLYTIRVFQAADHELAILLIYHLYVYTGRRVSPCCCRETDFIPTTLTVPGRVVTRLHKSISIVDRN